jgi:hypothetical protein
VARTAGLLSIAVLGIVMAAAYRTRLALELDRLDIPEPAREAALAASARLAEANVTADAPPSIAQAITDAVHISFISGFRTVVLIAAVCAVISAAFALLFIDFRAVKGDH